MAPPDWFPKTGTVSADNGRSPYVLSGLEARVLALSGAAGAAVCLWQAYGGGALPAPADFLPPVVSCLLAGGLIVRVLRRRIGRPLARLHALAAKSAEDGTMPPAPGKTLDVAPLAYVLERLLEEREWFSTQIDSCRAAVGTLSAPVFLLSREGGIEWANGAFSSLTGYDGEDLSGRPIGQILRCTDGTSLESMTSAMEKGERCTLSLQAFTKAGVPYWPEVELQPTGLPDNGGPAFIGLLRDGTPAHQMQAQLRELGDKLDRSRQALDHATQKTERQAREQHALAGKLNESRKAFERDAAAKAALLGRFAAELRAPLWSIRERMESLQAQGATESQRKDYDAITRDCCRFETLIETASELAESENADPAALTASDTEPEALLTEILNRIAGMADKNRTALAYQTEGPLPPAIPAEKPRLMRLLTELLTTLISRAANGTVEVTLSAPKTQKGLAFSAEMLAIPAIEQTDGADDEEEEGILEFALNAKRAELLGGRLETLQADGRLMGFRFSLPLDMSTTAPPRNTMKKGAPPMQASARHNRRSSDAFKERLDVLIAEDNAINQKLLAAVIENLGHQATVVPDGSEAIRAARAKTYDVILMDIQMPIIDGVMTTKILRSMDAPWARPPIIAVTANTLDQDQRLYAAAGIDALVGKPVDVSELASSIDRLIAAQ